MDRIEDLLGIAGLALHGDEGSANRLTALACACRITPSVVAYGAYDAVKVTAPARRLCEWLDEAADADDACIRRLVLLLACRQAHADTRPDRVVALAKELHRYATTS